jgi:hypothetical protein
MSWKSILKITIFKGALQDRYNKLTPEEKKAAQHHKSKGKTWEEAIEMVEARKNSGSNPHSSVWRTQTY